MVPVPEYSTVPTNQHKTFRVAASRQDAVKEEDAMSFSVPTPRIRALPLEKAEKRGNRKSLSHGGEDPANLLPCCYFPIITRKWDVLKPPSVGPAYLFNQIMLPGPEERFAPPPPPQAAGATLYLSTWSLPLVVINSNDRPIFLYPQWGWGGGEIQAFALMISY